MGRGLSPLQVQILEAIREIDPDDYVPRRKVERAIHYSGRQSQRRRRSQRVAFSRSLHRLLERGLVRGLALAWCHVGPGYPNPDAPRLCKEDVIEFSGGFYYAWAGRARRPQIGAIQLTEDGQGFLDELDEKESAGK